MGRARAARKVVAAAARAPEGVARAGAAVRAMAARRAVREVEAAEGGGRMVARAVALAGTGEAEVAAAEATAGLEGNRDWEGWGRAENWASGAWARRPGRALLLSLIL